MNAYESKANNGLASTRTKTPLLELLEMTICIILGRVAGSANNSTAMTSRRYSNVHKTHGQCKDYE